MLKILHIENIAVIEKAELEFGNGLNVLTGETGAGKSILIDALGAILGGRFSRELVRAGASGAMVTAMFSPETAGPWCAENGIGTEDGELCITRRIAADGKTVCRVNGCPVSVAQLRGLGGFLADIHGQNDGRKLLDEENHRAYLDCFGGLAESLDTYRAAYDRYRDTGREIERLTADESEKERRIDTLRFQIAELERADLKPGELNEKSARRDMLKNAGKLTDAVQQAYEALYGGDRDEGALGKIGDAEAAASTGARYSDKLDGIHAKLENLRYAAEDASDELLALREELNFVPGELEELDERIDLLHRLLRKYGGEEDAALRFLENCRTELESIETSGERLKVLKTELEKRRKEAGALADDLSQKRHSAAVKLEQRISGELRQLSMPGVRFETELSPAELGPFGCENVRFLMSANAGEVPGRISRIASGGELARIMLAMKNVLSEGDEAGTMVFDEIDTGVSGIAAQRVAEKLAALTASKQVICVTHLPQIAAMADEHYAIEKSVSDGRTYTKVTHLDGEGRKQEIARLTGGENVTITTLAAASEQIAAAEDYKVKMLRR